MEKGLNTKQTSLETANIENIGAILDWKLKDKSPEAVADYIAFSIKNLETKISNIKEAETNIKALKLDVQKQIETIKVGSAKWLNDAGVSKLNGMAVSSVSILNSKPKTKLIVTNEESLINAGYFKTVLDETAVKNAILEGNDIEGARIEIIHQEDKLKINNRTKKILDEDSI